MVITLALLVIAWGPSATAEGATYHAAPSGSGSACSKTTPCSFATALQTAGSGDTIIAANGVYKGSYTTKRAGVTIEAATKHGAILTDTSARRMFEILHSDITFRGFRLNGQKTDGDPSLLMVRATVDNVMIEHNWIQNALKAGIQVGTSNKVTHVTNIVIRHNLIEDMGWGGPGEAIYLGSDKGATIGADVVGIQIYGNILRRFTQQAVDAKPNTIKAEIHHNIMEGQLYRPNPTKPGVESTLVTRGAGHRVQDNIMRDLGDAGVAVLWTDATRDIQLRDNVILNVDRVTYAIATRGAGRGGTASQVFNNTFCNLSSHKVQAKDGLKVYQNTGIPTSAPQSACKAEVNRILLEIQRLSGSSYNGEHTAVPYPPNSLEVIRKRN